jgi:hypothetical protein
MCTPAQTSKTSVRKITALATGLFGLYLHGLTTKRDKTVMSSATERSRGTKEARQQLPVLREKWPIAFPANPN